MNIPERKRSLYRATCYLIKQGNLIKPFILDQPKKPKNLNFIFTDASLEGEDAFLGGIFEIKQKFLCFATHITLSGIPTNFREYCHIGVFELLALLVFILVPQISGNLVNCFNVFKIDNLGDVYSLLNGYSNGPLCAAILLTIFETFNRENIRYYYFSWVNTDDNTADVFTRSERFHILQQNFPKNEEIQSSLIPWSRISYYFDIILNW